MSRPELLSVPLHRVVAARHWDIHPFLEGEIPAGLRQSIETAGILHPPLLVESAGGGFEIIDGRRRLQAAREILGLTGCPCLVIPAASPPRAILALLLASQASCAPLSPMETAWFLRICSEFLSPEEIAERFLPSLTGRTSLSLLPRYDRLLSLESGLQRHVHQRRIAEAMALELLQLQAEDMIALAGLFVDFEMGGGKQRRFFSLARDVAMRAGTSITALLSQPPLTAILQHRQMNAPQKVQNLLAILQQMATPSLHGDEQAFKARVAALNLPSPCTVEHSQAFETDEVVLSIRFDVFARLQAASAPLVQALQDAGLSDT